MKHNTMIPQMWGINTCIYYWCSTSLGNYRKNLSKVTPHQNTLAPKTLVQCIMSCKVLSNASMQCLCTIGASSQIISLVSLSSSAKGDACPIAHVACSYVCFKFLYESCKRFERNFLSSRRLVNNQNVVICPYISNSPSQKLFYVLAKPSHICWKNYFFKKR